ncbi:MAG: ankyrin repeat domain-containing protein [Gemmatimonadaceae bacterium]
MDPDAFRLLIERGDVDSLRSALGTAPDLANTVVRWHLNRDNVSDPLHYVCDCVGQGWLSDDQAGKIAAVLLAAGAAPEGSPGREPPLLAATSLGADAVARVLIAAGADVNVTFKNGVRPLHWAAWTGAPETVDLLVRHGASVDAKCTEFQSTPLYWAVHGYSPRGPKEKRGQVEAARILLVAGASVNTANKDGVTALALAQQCKDPDMYELLRLHGEDPVGANNTLVKNLTVN